MNLKHLVDCVLLEDLKMLVANERVFLTKILHHIREVDDRKLFSDLNYSSLYDYAVKELGYSEAAASRRIQAARLLKQIPSIETKIESGALSLSNLAKAQRSFSMNNIKDSKEKKVILARIEHMSARECERELLSLMPTQPLPLETIKPISSDFNQLKINISDDTLRLMTEVKDLLSFHQINDAFLKQLTIEALTSLKKKKFKLTETPHSNQENQETRYITHQTKREVLKNSNGVCENCGSLFLLQFDHIQAFALGGKTETKNLRLLCFQCNQRARIRARL